MRTLLAVLQIAVALGLLNVWLLRARQRTAYRGGSATSMSEEFATYGLPEWFMYVIGFLKIAAAGLLIVGLWVPQVVVPTALLIFGLMVGALAMHLKVGDPIQKSVPALLVLATSVAIALGTV
jgi:hypothetical protein